MWGCKAIPKAAPEREFESSGHLEKLEETEQRRALFNAETDAEGT